MDEFVGERCKIEVLLYGKRLHYEALVKSVSDSMITFEDKFGDKYAFRVRDVQEISPLSRKRRGGVSQ